MMTINEQGAQLIFDVLAWNNYAWVNGYNSHEPLSDEIIEQAREDFVQFCKFYGIDSVEVNK